MSSSVNNATGICNDIWMHIFQYLNHDSLFNSIAPVNTSFQQLGLESMLRDVEYRGGRYIEWFVSYTASRYINSPSSISERDKEQVIKKTRELNYECLRKTYIQFSDWSQFMDELCNTLAPRLLFKSVRTGCFDQQSRALLVRVLDLIFALDHLKMLQCHVSNDLSMFRRVCSVLMKESEFPTHEWMEIVSIMRTEFYYSKKSLFSSVSEAKSSEFLTMLQQFNGSMQDAQQHVDEEERLRGLRVGLMLLGVMEARRASTRQLKHHLNLLGKRLPKFSKSTIRKVPLLPQSKFPDVVYSPSFFMSKCASQTEQLYHKIK